MKVRDIVLSAAKILGIEERVNAYFDGGDWMTMREAELLLHCFNLVENQLALDYLPLTAEESFRSLTGRLEFGTFSHAPVRILQLKDERGEEIPYTLFPKYLYAQPGLLTVKYTYTPVPKTIDEESDFGISAAPYMFTYGVLVEYYMAEGLFEEAAAWDKKYKKAIETAYGLKPCKRLSERRWV